MSKGDNRRPTDAKKFGPNYDRIKKAEKVSGKVIKNEPGVTRIVYGS